MKKLLLAVAAAVSISLAGCTAAQLATANSVVDVAGNVCQVIIAATDPTLVPVCTTATGIASAITALIAAHVPTAADATTPYAPSNDEVYKYLVAHGAKLVKH